jgi:hypothetical protein
MQHGGAGGLKYQLKKRSQPALSSLVFRSAWEVKAPLLEFATGDTRLAANRLSDVVPVR